MINATHMQSSCHNIAQVKRVRTGQVLGLWQEGFYEPTSSFGDYCIEWTNWTHMYCFIVAGCEYMAFHVVQD